MQKTFIHNMYGSPQFDLQNEERFIWPLVPFLGGAIIGYVAGRPQYNYAYPAYYPVYYPLTNNNYYQQPYTYYNRNKFNQYQRSI